MSNNNKGVVLDRRSREIITNVDKYFADEKQRAATLLHQLSNAVNSSQFLATPTTLTRDVCLSLMEFLGNTVKVTERVHLATGVNKNTITRIRKENEQIATVPKKVQNKMKKENNITITRIRKGKEQRNIATCFSGNKISQQIRIVTHSKKDNMNKGEIEYEVPIVSILEPKILIKEEIANELNL